MTDSVFIAGSNSGALNTAFEGLPPWATQATIEEIKGLIAKSNSIQAQTLSTMAKSMGGSGLSPDDIKEVNAQLSKLGKNLVEQDKEFPKEKKRWKDTEANFARRKDGWSTALRSGAAMLGMSLSLEAAGYAIIRTMFQNIDTFDMLHASGVNMVGGMTDAANGFESLQQLTAITGVRYTELAKTMAKFSTSVNNFGAAKFAKTMAAASVELRSFGYTTQETGDLLGGYLDAQRNFQTGVQKSQSEVTAGIVKFGKNINDLSMATGMAKAKIMENYDALSKSVEANLLASQTGSQASEATLEFIASFKDQNLGKAFLTMMTDSIKPLNATFQSLQRAGNGAFAMKEQNLIKSLEGMSAEEKKKHLAEFGAANETEIRQMMQRNNLLAQAGNADAKAANEHLSALMQESKAYNALTEEEKKKIAMTADATKRMKNAWERFLSAFQILFVPLIGVLDGISFVLEFVNGVVSDMSTVLSGIMKPITLFWGVIGDSLSWISEKLGGFTDSMATKFPLLASLVNGIGGFLSGTLHIMRGIGGIALVLGAVILLLTKKFGVLGTILDAVKKGGLGGLLGGKKGGKGGPAVWTTSYGADGSGGPAGKAGKAGKGGGLASSLGKGMADIGKGIGSFLGSVGKGAGVAISGILKGLASGLSALGKPQVLLGTLALIGVGAAVWIAAKAFQGFNGVNWEDVKIGLGMLTLFTLGAVAAGMALPMIAAGALAIGLVGAAAWVAGKGLASLAEGTSAMATTIEILGKVDGENLLKVALGIGAISAAMIAFSAASAAGGVGSAIGAVGGAISKLFGGGGDVFTQIQAFAGMSDRLEMAASAIGSISTTMSTLSSAVSSFEVDVLKDIVNTINSIDVLKAAAFALIGNTGPKNSYVGTAPTTSASQIDPTAPKASTINSPSASNTETAKDMAAPVIDTPSTPASGIKEPSGDSSINSSVAFQTSLLEQILLSINNSVSVNKDILKATKNA